MDRFDEILRARAQRWAPQGVVEQTAQHEVRITQPDGATTTVNVAPIAWQFADASDAEVAERVDRQLALLAEAAGSTPQTVPWQRLMPLLRSASFMTASAMRGQVVIEPVDDFLCVALGIDHSDGIQMVSKADLGRWNVGVDQLFNAAFWNLRSQVGPQSFEFSDVGQEREVALLRGVAPYGYQTSLAFVGDLARQLGSGAGGAPPVVFFPSRNDLFVIPANRFDLLAAGFDEALALYQQHPQPLVPVPYTYDSRGLLTPWRPPGQLQDRSIGPGRICCMGSTRRSASSSSRSRTAWPKAPSGGCTSCQCRPGSPGKVGRCWTRPRSPGPTMMRPSCCCPSW